MSKERGILFRGEMVRAILEWRKTQMRRPIVPQPKPTSGNQTLIYGGMVEWGIPTDRFYEYRSCPFGSPGGHLWVRETFSTSGLTRYHETGDLSDHGGPGDRCCAYAATGTYKCGKKIPNVALAVGAHRWRPSIHMPRWASRILLEITNVRVERIQDIGHDGRKAADVMAEGVTQFQIDVERKWFHPEDSPAIAFSRGWNATYAKKGYGWEANPWVWVIEFRRVA